MQTLSLSGRTDDGSFEQWRSAICEQFMPLRPEPSAPGQEFYGALRSWNIAGLTLSTIGAKGQQVHRGRAEISRCDLETLFLSIHLYGQTGIAHGERRTTMRGGDVYLLDGRSPFTIHCDGGLGLSLTIPRSVCHDRLMAFDRLHGVVRSPGNMTDRLLQDYLFSLATGGEAFSATEAADIADHLVELVGHSLSRHQPTALPPRRAVRAAAFLRALRLIDRGMRDPDFTPTALARLTGVSLRQLQALCAENDTTPARAIRERRLALAKRMLRDSTCVGKTITRIAFESGFADLTHFGRVFLAATGQTPREWRQS